MITSLTKAQEADLKKTYGEWLAIGRSCAPIDREAATKVIGDMYEKIGEKRPVVLYFSSPIMCLLAYSVLSKVNEKTPKSQLEPQLEPQLASPLWSQLGSQLASQLWSQLASQLASQLESQLWSQLESQLGSQLWSPLASPLGSQLWSQLASPLWSQLRSQLGSQLWSQLASQLESQLASQLASQLESQLRSQLWSQLGSQLWSPLESQLWSQLASQLESQLGSQLRSQLSNYWGGHQWCAWQVFYDFCRRIGVHYKEENGEMLTLWLDQSKNCHWWWPYKGIVLASERHTALHLDEQGRLHNPNGLAVEYADGWGVYAVHGVRVSKKVIEKQFTWRDIDKETNSEVRRVMMDLYGAERYILDSGIKPIHSDDFGTLYRRDNADGSVFLVVKVVNSTPEPDGSYRDYWLRCNHTHYQGDAGKIAHAAVASTWRTQDGKLAFERYQDYLPCVET